MLALVVRVFDDRVVELIGRWWNGKYGRTARRDVWLYRASRDGFVVHARHGGSEGELRRWPAMREYEARNLVDRLKESAGGDWRDLSRLYPPGRQVPPL